MPLKYRKVSSLYGRPGAMVSHHSPNNGAQQLHVAAKNETTAGNMYMGAFAFALEQESKTPETAQFVSTRDALELIGWMTKAIDPELGADVTAAIAMYDVRCLAARNEREDKS